MATKATATVARPAFHAALFSVEAYHSGQLLEIKPLGSGSFGSVRFRRCSALARQAWQEISGGASTELAATAAAARHHHAPTQCRTRRR